MTAEQLAAVVGLILGIVFAAAIVYSMNRKRYRFPAYKVGLLVLFIGSSIVRSFEGDAIGVLFAWFSCIISLFCCFMSLNLGIGR